MGVGAFFCGGGSYNGVLNHCTLSHNSASTYGGGSFVGYLKNCVLTENSAKWLGGGAMSATLANCTLSDNLALYSSGGTYDCTLNNCIVWENTAPHDPNYLASRFSYSCTTPLPSGSGNISDDPLFVDPANDLRLKAGSPCIDSGTALPEVTNDLDGVPRPLDGNADGIAAYDMGAYEYVSNLADSDGDGMRDGEESIAGTGLLNSDHLFKINDLDRMSPDYPTLTWQSVAGRLYTILYQTNLLMIGTEGWKTSVVDIVGTGGLMSTNVPGADQIFYQIRVRKP